MSLPWPLLWLLTSALRVFPWPTRPGLRPVGQPDANSPVLLTCSFALTVALVERVLRGRDAWLLVANSRGINVWCAATGGHLSTHEAVSVLKTSGISEQVEHRRVILPQLAATGIEVDELQQRTGWRAVWGPVDVHDLPAFLDGDDRSAMRQIRFDLLQRLEMAIMWATPLSLLSLFVLLFDRTLLLPLLALIWAMSLLVYTAFPLYEALLRPPRQGGPTPVGVRFLLFVTVFGVMAVAGVALTGASLGSLRWSFLLRWGGAGVGVVLVLAFELAGSTPLYKSWTHDDRRFRVVLDEDLCIACDRCVEVCPRGVFVVEDVAVLAHAERCEQCGACIVQCPVDALAFETLAGERVSPEAVRRYKLNLLGRRAQG